MERAGDKLKLVAVVDRGCEVMHRYAKTQARGRGRTGVKPGVKPGVKGWRHSGRKGLEKMALVWPGPKEGKAQSWKVKFPIAIGLVKLGRLSQQPLVKRH